jgi:two-component system sensor histidine kinase DcuS
MVTFSDNGPSPNSSGDGMKDIAESIPPARKRLMRMKLSTAVTLMISSVIGSVLLLVYALWFIQISDTTRDGVKDTALAVARTFSDMPEVKQALALPPQSGLIQPLALAITRRNDLLYAVVTDMHGVRYSHPNARLIGKRFIGEDIQPAFAGKENVAVNHGVLAPALRVFTPVFNDRQQQIGVVVVGISLSKVDEQIAKGRWDVLLTVLFSALVCGIGTWSLVRGLKRVLLGLEPQEISTQFQQRQAMLHSLKEGVVAVDVEGRVTLINPAASEILLSGPGKEIAHTPLLADLHEVLQTGEPIYDRELGCNGFLLISNTVPVRSQNAIVGAISTFRDKTEVSQLLQRLDGMVNYVDALRTTSHEFMNKLHVILGLLNMKSYDKLEEYVLQTAHTYQADIGEIQHRIKSPVVAGFLIGKIQRAKERGFTLNLAEESLVPDCPNEKQVTVLVTVLGNLIENALDAMSGQSEGEVGLLLHYQNGWLSGEVSDDGPGIPPANIDAIFNKGFSTKGENRGVGLFLASQQLRELGGTLAVESEPGVFTQFFVHLPWDSKRKRA